jgi:hypothetical protein
MGQQPYRGAGVAEPSGKAPHNTALAFYKEAQTLRIDVRLVFVIDARGEGRAAVRR